MIVVPSNSVVVRITFVCMCAQAHVCLVYIECYVSVNNHYKNENLKDTMGQMIYFRFSLVG